MLLHYSPFRSFASKCVHDNDDDKDDDDDDDSHIIIIAHWHPILVNPDLLNACSYSVSI